MSWNFEVKGRGAADAQRLFENAVFENAVHIDNTTQQKLKSSARSLLYNVPSTHGREATVAVRSYGHIDNVTGYGNMSVAVEYTETPEEEPVKAG